MSPNGPNVIRTQAEAQAARKATRFCYLCGEQLRSPGDTRSRITNDHIIPKAVLLPSRDHGDWPFILRVHATCHGQKNSVADDILTPWHRVMSGDSEIYNRQDVAVVRKVCTPLNQQDGLLPATPVSIDTRIPDGVWNWVRGFHAGLFAEYLPNDTRQHAFLPMPQEFLYTTERGTGRRMPGLSVSQMQRQRELILQAIELVSHDGRANTVEFWSGRCTYKAMWLRVSDHFQCWWALCVPNVQRHSEGLGLRGLPWLGGYERTALPDGAIAVSLSEVRAMTHEHDTAYPLPNRGKESG